jgi:hypothetical protein
MTKTIRNIAILGCLYSIHPAALAQPPIGFERIQDPYVASLIDFGLPEEHVTAVYAAKGKLFSLNPSIDNEQPANQQKDWRLIGSIGREFLHYVITTENKVGAVQALHQFLQPLHPRLNIF